MKVIKMKIIDLQDGLVLGKDLFIRNKIFMKKGCELNLRIISLLKKHEIQSVYIQSNELEHLQGKYLVKSQRNFVIQDTINKPNFSLVLAELSTEVRYGHALKDKEGISYVHGLFEKYMKNIHYREMLFALRRYDYYSYLHSIDVFTLCTLFSIKVGLQNIEEYAIGFLFHDIRKLKTPTEILKKEGKLSDKEFKKMVKYTEDGYEILCKVKLESVAHLAKLHHEQIDDSSYPEELKAAKLPLEVLILQLIDLYSAITLNRCYTVEIDPAKAIAMMVKNKHVLDEKLFERFVEFIGIYPENTIDLLADGYRAFIENVNNMYPLLPSVRKLDANRLFVLPMDIRRILH